MMLVLFAALSAAAPAKPAKRSSAPAPGTWTVSTTTSPIDDSPTVVVSTRADKDISGWPRKTVRPELVVRCKEGKIDVYVTTGMTAAGEYRSGTMRFDKQTAVRGSWANATDHEAIFYADWPPVITFIEDLAVAHTLLIELLP